MTTISSSSSVGVAGLSGQGVLPAGYRGRSRFLPVPFIVPILLGLTSYLGGGVATLNDMAFLILTVLCAILFANELIHFSHRFGVAGIVLFGGVLIWFSYDYFKNWYGVDLGHKVDGVNDLVIARNVLMHTVFIFMMVIGLLLPFGRWLEKPFFLIPDPSWRGLYLLLAIALTIIGVLPYFLWAVDVWYMAIWQDVVGQRYHGARWFLRGPGGNYNLTHSWGAYIALMMKGGKFGGQIAAVYAILVARALPAKMLGWLIWLFWLIMSFGSGTRGQVVVMILPPVAVLFIKHHALAAMVMRRVSKRAYLWSILLGLGMVWLVQVQIAFRGTTLDKGDFSAVKMTELTGNTMFSSGLPGMMLIPKKNPYFHDTFVGERFLRPLPDTAFRFCIGMIPRAIWHGKPMDKADMWYNQTIFGTVWGAKGPNATPGIVTWWYVRYGLPGVIQGGLLFGWLLVISERVLQKAEGRMITILLGLSLSAWLFRSYRQWFYHDFYPIVIAAFGLFLAVKLTEMLNVRRAG